jgi:hypothetical protein
MKNEKENNGGYSDDYCNPVDPEEDAVDSREEAIPDFPKKNRPTGDDEQPLLPGHIESPALPEHPSSLNRELAEKIKEDPNKFLGCGG